jgi:3',5'-cyclic AMP phosphodiesterase CpdA
MRIVLHLSDLHFGRVDYRMLGPLASAAREVNPHLVAVSGDLTQRARPREFREARDFLATLPQPQVVVPGNHDVPLHDPLARFFWPMRNWKRHLGTDLEPVYQDDEIVAAGVNTARSFTVKGGRINRSQVERVLSRICEAGDLVTKIVVTHHPFDLPEGHSERALLGRARRAMAHFARCGADLFLAGHLHLGYAVHTAERYRIAGHSALVVQAGTAVSTRGRGELNSFNVLRVEHPLIDVERWEWAHRPEGVIGEGGERGRFALAETQRFEHGAHGWRPA